MTTVLTTTPDRDQAIRSGVVGRRDILGVMPGQTVLALLPDDRLDRAPCEPAVERDQRVGAGTILPAPHKHDPGGGLPIREDAREGQVARVPVRVAYFTGWDAAHLDLARADAPAVALVDQILRDQIDDL